jgi:hypothetical protein
VGPTAPAPEARADQHTPAASRSPLDVTIGTMTPAAVPRRGTVTVSGTVTNRSRSTWTDLNVYLLLSSSPITTVEELTEATVSDAGVEVGARITEPGLYDVVRDLQPGESTEYLLSVPRRALPVDEPGVYWLNVHVLGSNEDGRDAAADGRARTFVPWLPAEEPSTTVSLVMPVKARVTRTRDGRVGNVRQWARLLGDDGRLTRLLELSGTSLDVPLTWVVDPAVVDAASSLAAGNPAFDTGPTDRPTDAGSGAEGSPSPSPAPEDGDTDLSDEQKLRAAGWLEDFIEQTADHAVLTVPFGDLDLASVLRHGSEELYDLATTLSAQTLDEVGIRGTPVIAPPDGRLPNDALEELDTSATLLLDAAAVDSEDTVVRLREGHLVIRGDQVARIGGPAPNGPFDALALRQMVLARAALQALSEGSGQPLVISLPEGWDPGARWRSAAFFAALDQPWLRTVNLPFVTAVADPGAYGGRLDYSRRLLRQELPPANIRAALGLERSGSTLVSLLTRNDTVDEQVSRAAVLATSFHARKQPRSARVRASRTLRSVRSRLERVFVESSSLVTMSSETGNFSVTVVNDLDESVTVGVAAETVSDELTIRSPDLVTLRPGQRASVRLAVASAGTGVHSVQLMPTTEDGRPLGRATTIRVRSSQVGLVIWLIVGTGAVVFLVAITLRVVRRVRERKKTPGPLLQRSGP